MKTYTVYTRRVGSTSIVASPCQKRIYGVCGVTSTSSYDVLPTIVTSSPCRRRMWYIRRRQGLLASTSFLAGASYYRRTADATVYASTVRRYLCLNYIRIKNFRY